MAAVVAVQLHLDLMNECLVQWLHGITQNHIDSKEVISCFDDIIDLDCFAAGDDAVGFVQQLDLVARQPVAGHSTVTVDHVDLDIVVKTAILSTVSLLDQIFEKWRDLRRIHCVFFDPRRFSCIFGDLPDTVILCQVRDTSFGTIPSDESFGNAPFLCRFLYCDVTHTCLPFN